MGKKNKKTTAAYIHDTYMIFKKSCATHWTLSSGRLHWTWGSRSEESRRRYRVPAVSFLSTLDLPEKVKQVQFESKCEDLYKFIVASHFFYMLMNRAETKDDFCCSPIYWFLFFFFRSVTIILITYFGHLFNQICLNLYTLCFTVLH